MKIKERLQKLHDECYKVKHKTIGTVDMDERDLIRIRGVEQNKTVKDYCDFLYANRLTKNNIMQHIDGDLLEKEIVHEEILMLGVDCSIDMFVSVN